MPAVAHDPTFTVTALSNHTCRSLVQRFHFKSVVQHRLSVLCHRLRFQKGNKLNLVLGWKAAGAF